MEIIYNKLIRDRIPEIITADSKVPITRVLSDEEYKLELEKKLMEEYNEVLEETGNKRIEELADMYEVIKSLAEFEGSSIEKVVETANIKFKKRGGFDKKIFLEKVVTNE